MFAVMEQINALTMATDSLCLLQIRVNYNYYPNSYLTVDNPNYSFQLHHDLHVIKSVMNKTSKFFLFLTFFFFFT